MIQFRYITARFLSRVFVSMTLAFIFIRPVLATPVVVIDSPLDGAVLQGTVDLSVSATDQESFIVRLSLRVGPTILADTGQPFIIGTYPVTQYPDGTYTLTAEAWDDEGNRGETSITVTVNNNPPDTTAPEVSITSPMDGMTIERTPVLGITAVATDNVAVTRVDFYLDGSLLGEGEEMWPPGTYNTTINPLSYPDGSHTIRVEAFDAAGNTTQDEITVTFNTADTTAPEVSITYPTDGTVIDRTTNLVAFVSDDVGVAEVQFLMDGMPLGLGTPIFPPGNYQFVFNPAGVSDGSHEISVEASDAAGNIGNDTVTISINTMPSDTVPPTISIQTPSSGQTVSGNVNILVGTAFDNVGITEVRFLIDGLPLSVDTTVPYQALWDSAQVPNGSHQITAEAYDAAGNKGEHTITVTVNNVITDTTPPLVTITTPEGSDEVTGVISVEATATDNIGVTQVRFILNGATVLTTDTLAPYQATLDTRTLPNGPITIMAEALDAAGNRGEDEVSVGVNNPPADTTPPTVTITSPLDGATVGGTVIILANATDNVAVTEVRFYIDGILLNTDTSAPYQATWVTSGNREREITAEAWDAAGNRSQHVINVDVSNIVPDTTPPTVAITSPASDAVVSGMVSIAATASDNFSVTEVRFYIDGALSSTDNSAPYQASWDSAGASNGPHLIKAEAWDAAGNKGEHIITVNVNNVAPDTTPPTVMIISPADGARLPKPILIVATASDNLGVTEVRFYERSTLLNIDTTPPYEAIWNPTSNRERDITAEAWDAAGNRSEHTISIDPEGEDPDVTPPTVIITSPVDGAIVTGVVAIAATATDDLLMREVRFYVDGVLHTTDVTDPYQASLDSTLLSNGTHEIKAEAVDAVGNTAEHAITINVNNVVPDTTPPVVTITSPLDGATVGGTVIILANATDNVAVTEVRFYIDGVLLNTDTSAPYQATWVTSGNREREITAEAWDAAGNKGEHIITVNVNNVVPDTTPPVVAILSPSHLGTVSGNVTIAVSATDNIGVTQVRFYIDGSLLSTDTIFPYAALWNTLLLTNGSHEIKAEAYDAAGNRSEHIITVTIANGVPDTTSPIITIVSLFDGAIVSGSVRIEAQASDNVGVTETRLYIDGNPIAVDFSVPYQWDWASGSAPNGPHQIKVEAYDAAGNKGEHVITVTVSNTGSDTVPPLIRITSPNRLSGNARLAATASDNVRVREVRFLIEGLLLRLLIDAPYEATWATWSVPDGVYRVRAEAFDAAGNRGSDEMTVTVVNNVPDLPPVVDFLSHDDRDVIRDTVDIKVGATDDFGVSQVELFVDNDQTPVLLLGNTPYTFSWNTRLLVDGQHTIRVRATDNAGHSTDETISLIIANNGPAASNENIEDQSILVSTPGQDFEIHYHMEAPGFIEMDVYTRSGEKIRTVFSGAVPSGAGRQTFSGDDLSSGMYLLRIRRDSGTSWKKIVEVH